MHGNFETLTALAARIEAVETAKEDYLVHTTAMHMEDDDHLSITPNGHTEVFGLNDVAHSQVAGRLALEQGLPFIFSSQPPPADSKARAPCWRQ